MDAIFQRQIAGLNYVEPEDLLREVMVPVEGILQKPETVRHISAKDKKPIMEKYQAGYLALLLKRNGESQGAEVKVAFKEAADFDCALRVVHPVQGTAYKLVQLKQLPAEEVSPDVTLQGVVDGLKGKYRDPHNLIVAIWINRNIKLAFEDVDFTGLEIEQLWFFGDAVNGDLTLDGGQVSDLTSGWRWSSRLRGFDREVRPVQFRPLQPA